MKYKDKSMPTLIKEILFEDIEEFFANIISEKAISADHRKYVSIEDVT